MYLSNTMNWIRIVSCIFNETNMYVISCLFFCLLITISSWVLTPWVSLSQFCLWITFHLMKFMNGSFVSRIFFKITNNCWCTTLKTWKYFFSIFLVFHKRLNVFLSLFFLPNNYSSETLRNSLNSWLHSLESRQSTVVNLFNKSSC